MEEPQFCVRYYRGVACVATNHRILSSYETFKKSMTWKDRHYDYIVRCMTRTLWCNNSHQNNNLKTKGVKRIYVGCMLDLMDYEQLFNTFGDCKFICNLRDPVSTNYSYTCLLDAIWRRP
eukprot:UN18589